MIGIHKNGASGRRIETFCKGGFSKESDRDSLVSRLDTLFVGVGTWAAQKIIDCSTSPEEITIIAQSLRAYTPPLLLDQFGNYVVS